ncbi:allantoate deiminase 2-like [Phoenix dactylifera]|uniref:Allantoate deiminase 2-like n=1 Tax=Phoenix dactylifera TaxID=42345 RepID=A0A8B9AP02_PHODC|nr:allantoate deiminase 2-like [Phoenix dactylifera]XP_038988497.1 allantoate deiminase 2-like [Phoenix dactylifera]XP_038988498.1 allantoate deiminase 2-like [Phoenix dactylifera]
MACILPPSALQLSVQDVLRENSFDTTEESLVQVKCDPKSIQGYAEVHIEQGPAMETLGCPLSVVKGIAGQTRWKKKNYLQINVIVDGRAMDVEAKEVEVSEFSSQVYQIWEQQMVNCTIEH